MSVSDEIMKLHDLLIAGVLTQEEYDKQKSIILDATNLQKPTNNASPMFVSAYENKSADIRYRQEKSKLHTMGVLSIVFAFISPLVAWILGGVGMSKASQLLIEFPNSQEIENEKSLCKTGVIIGIVVFVLALIIGFFVFLSM